MSRHVFRAQDYVEHMLECCRRMEHYITGKGLDQFLADTMLQDAVTRNLEVLDEASKQLRDVLPDAPGRFPQIPFPVIYSLRNRMIHAYSFTTTPPSLSSLHKIYRHFVLRWKPLSLHGPQT